MIKIQSGLGMDKKRLKDFIHPHWGSIVGQENDIRITVLKEEVALWEKRCEDNPDDIPYLGYIRTTLKDRVKELEEDERLDQEKDNGTKRK